MGLPATYSVFREGAVTEVSVGSEDELLTLRSELALLGAIAAATPPRKAGDEQGGIKLETQDELARIHVAAHHRLNCETTECIDAEFPALREELEMNVIDQEAARIAEEINRTNNAKATDQPVAESEQPEPAPGAEASVEPEAAAAGLDETAVPDSVTEQAEEPEAENEPTEAVASEEIEEVHCGETAMQAEPIEPLAEDAEISDPAAVAEPAAEEAPVSPQEDAGESSDHDMSESDRQPTGTRAESADDADLDSVDAAIQSLETAAAELSASSENADLDQAFEEPTEEPQPASAASDGAADAEQPLNAGDQTSIAQGHQCGKSRTVNIPDPPASTASCSGCCSAAQEVEPRPEHRAAADSLAHAFEDLGRFFHQGAGNLWHDAHEALQQILTLADQAAELKREAAEVLEDLKAFRHEAHQEADAARAHHREARDFLDQARHAAQRAVTKADEAEIAADRAATDAKQAQHCSDRARQYVRPAN